MTLTSICIILTFILVIIRNMIIGDWPDVATLAVLFLAYALEIFAR